MEAILVMQKGMEKNGEMEENQSCGIPYLYVAMKDHNIAQHWRAYICSRL